MAATRLPALRQDLKNMGVHEMPLVLAVISVKDLKPYGGYADEYLDLLMDVMHPGATLVMNAFSWSFCKSKIFDIEETPAETGLASEVFRRLPGVGRSPHPIYSICAKGPLSNIFLKHTGDTCLGTNTPFEALTQHNAFCLLIGKAFPFAIALWHSFEEWRQVPYRIYKSFEGQVNFGDGPKAYCTRMYVRREPDLHYAWDPAVRRLHQNKLIGGQQSTFPLHGVYAQDLRNAAYSCMDEDIEIFIPKARSTS